MVSLKEHAIEVSLSLIAIVGVTTGVSIASASPSVQDNTDRHEPMIFEASVDDVIVESKNISMSVSGPGRVVGNRNCYVSQDSSYISICDSKKDAEVNVLRDEPGVKVRIVCGEKTRDIEKDSFTIPKNADDDKYVIEFYMESEKEENKDDEVKRGAVDNGAKKETRERSSVDTEAEPVVPSQPVDPVKPRSSSNNPEASERHTNEQQAISQNQNRYEVCLPDDMDLLAGQTIDNPVSAEDFSNSMYINLINKRTGFLFRTEGELTAFPAFGDVWFDHRYGTGVGDYIHNVSSPFASMSRSILDPDGSRSSEKEFEVTYNPRCDQFESALKSTVRNLRLGGLSDREKAIEIERWITEHVHYETGTADDKTAISGLLDGKCNCQGYAILFSRMCKKAGLDAVCVTGAVSGGRHMWDMVRIDGCWTSFDPCWADDGSTLDWDYMFRGDASMGGERTPDPEYL